MIHFNNVIKIKNCEISKNSKTFIIAEAGVNHNGDMNIAKKLIDCAREARADAVKFQMFKTENVILKNIPKAPYQKETTDPKELQFDMLKKLEITKEENLELRAYCANKNIIFLTTIYDGQSLEELADFDLPAYKIASTDITNLPFVKKIAERQRPLILSTGMAYLSEVKTVLEEIYPLNRDVILMQCTANYPVEDEEVNLKVIDLYKEQFDILIGYSDHSTGVGASPYAVAMGAKVIEKHFTLDKNLPGPDHKASVTCDELKRLVYEIRKVEKYLGSNAKNPTRSEQETRKSLQKCLVARRMIKKGEIFSEENITQKRTGGMGISPIDYKEVFGKPANRDYEKDAIISLNAPDKKTR